MEKIYKIRESTIESIADAIRAKAGTIELINPLDMAEEILSLQLGDIDFSAQTATTDNVEEGYTFYNNYGLLDVGTGGGINFKVVGGTTPPENTTENTIWVNTSMEITEYALDSDHPNYLPIGGVWIQILNIDNIVKFNILKKHYLIASPYKLWQWDGSRFVPKSGALYQDGIQTFTYIGTRELFPYEANSWTHVARVTGISSIDSSTISLTSGGSSDTEAGKAYAYSEEIDFSLYNTITITYSKLISNEHGTHGRCKIGILPTDITDVNVQIGNGVWEEAPWVWGQGHQTSDEDHKGTVTYDISGVNSKGRLWLLVYSGLGRAYMDVTNITLE